MATIVYPVAAFTSGLNVLKRDGRFWNTMNVRAGQKRSLERRKRGNCAWVHQKRAQIIAEIHGIGIRNICSVDSSYFEGNLRYIKVCAKFVPHTLKPHEKDLRIFDYLTKNCIVTINHSPYSSDMAPCDFYMFGKLHLAMKGKRYADVDAIQKASTAILNVILKDDLLELLNSTL